MTRCGYTIPFLSVSLLALLLAVPFGGGVKETGTVEVSGEGIEAVLYSLEGGARTVRSGRAASLPAGTYRVASFSRTHTEPFARVSYTGPAKMTLTVTAGKTALLDLDPVLVAKVKVRKGRGRVLLSLEMATAQGARFSRYYHRSPAGAAAGIPFLITDGKGNVVVEDSFHFG